MNPQKALFKMLAESRLRIRHMRAVHGRSLSAIPSRQNSLTQELSQLAEQIRTVGIGGNPELENRYLELARQRSLLDESYEMHPQASDPIPSGLQKAIAYGEMLLSIYGGGALIKGARYDLESVGATLAQSQNQRASQLGKKLLALVDETRRSATSIKSSAG
jgi:hypothetical protein